jgi:single-strand DNA-binding protein
MVANFTWPPATAFRTRRATGRTAPSGTTLVAFKRTAEIVRDYVKKGSKLYIEGKLQTRSWDDKETGVKKYRTEIIVNDLVLLSSREEGGGSSRPASSSSSAASFDQRQPAGQDDIAQSAEISDDDIPF